MTNQDDFLRFGLSSDFCIQFSVSSVLLWLKASYDRDMEHRTFGKTGLSVSVLGFGAAPAAYLKAEQEAAAHMLNGLLDQGLNLIDTATSYPGSHEFLGQHFSGRRDDFVLVSKCGAKTAGIDLPAWSKELVTTHVDNALKALKTDRLDVMLLHSCDLETLKKGDALAALVAAREAGKIRHVGYSGDNEALAYAAGLADVAVVETSINIADQHNIDLGLRVARDNHVGVLAKRPIANAAWKDIATQQGLYKNYAKTYTDRLLAMNLDPAGLGFPGDRADAWSELALRFTLMQPGVTTAIVGTTNAQNAAKNIAVAAKGPLKPDVAEKIRAAFKAAANDTWTGQT